MSPELENSVSSFGEEACVPNLWTHVSGSQEYDMEMGLNSKEMENVHDIRPTDDFDWASDTFDDNNPVSPELENSVSSFGEEACVPNLWTHVSGSQEYDMEMGLNSKEMEKVHDIRPTVHYSKRNLGLFDPLKVGVKHIILFILSLNRPEVVPPPKVMSGLMPPPTPQELMVQSIIQCAFRLYQVMVCSV